MVEPDDLAVPCDDSGPGTAYHDLVADAGAHREAGHLVAGVRRGPVGLFR
jgi:hypothetical protein